MAYTARFDAKTKKIVVEIDADDDAFKFAPLSSSAQNGKTTNRLLASAGKRVDVRVPGQPEVTVAVNGWFKPVG